MGRDLLSETIEATADYDYANGEDTEANVMSYPPSYSAGSCPEAVGTITVNQTILEAGESATQTSQTFTGESGTTLTLDNTPLAGMLVTLSADGTDLTPTTDYTVSGATITKASGSFSADVTYVATYWYEV